MLGIMQKNTRGRENDGGKSRGRIRTEIEYISRYDRLVWTQSEHEATSI